MWEWSLLRSTALLALGPSAPDTHRSVFQVKANLGSSRNSQTLFPQDAEQANQYNAIYNSVFYSTEQEQHISAQVIL